MNNLEVEFISFKVKSDYVDNTIILHNTEELTLAGKICKGLQDAKGNFHIIYEDNGFYYSFLLLDEFIELDSVKKIGG